MSSRTSIVKALVENIKQIDGATPYNSALYGNVEGRQVFWDEVNDFPYVCINAGTETREYQAADFKWGFLLVSIKIYTKGDDPQAELEDILEDIEYVLDLNHSSMVYNDVTGKKTCDIRVLQISTDEGVLHPIGVGEMLIQVRYDL